MIAPEFPRPFRVDTLAEVPRTVAIAAEPAERAALAQRFGLVAIDRLEADAAVRRAGEAVHAEGRVRAAVTQSCAATGEPVPATIDEPFTLRFLPETSLAAAEELELAPDDLDTIGYDGSLIDLGEAVAETLALALDPFPRSPNADAVLRAAGVKSEEEASPFAKLKGLLS